MRRSLQLAAASLLSTLAPTSPLLAADEPLAFRGGLTWINAYVRRQVLDEPRNPQNQALRLAQDAFVSELRPNLKVVSSSLQLVARPRVTFTYSQARVLDELETAHPESRSSFSEAFLQWTASESLTVAYGKQSYQWGAAESLSPSNRMFHETVEARNFLYDVQGKHIARVNLSLGKTVSAVFMTEFEADRKNPELFRSEEEFKPTSLAKLEANWNAGLDYVGLVGGARQEGRAPWIGEYASLQLPFWDAVSVYGDASHERGSAAWYPTTGQADTPAGPQEVIVYDQTKKDDDHVYTLAVGGLRYDFEGGSTIRLEYVFDEAGYGEGERKLEKRAFARDAAPWQQALFEQNVRRSLLPGLELPGRRFGFVSFYWPKLFDIQDLTVYVRALTSLTDRSTSAYGSAEYAVGDAGAVLVSAAGNRGGRGDELRGFSSSTYLAGYKHQW